MKSRDGFEEVNRELREGAWRDDPLTRRAMLQALGVTAAGLTGLTAGLPGLAQAQTPALLRKREPELAPALDAWLRESGTPEAQVRCVLMRARKAWLVAVLDAATARPIKMLIAQKI